MATVTMVAASDPLGVASVSTRGGADYQEGGQAIRHLGLGLVSSGVLEEEEEGGEGLTFWPPVLAPL